MIKYYRTTTALKRMMTNVLRHGAKSGTQPGVTEFLDWRLIERHFCTELRVGKDCGYIYGYLIGVSRRIKKAEALVQLGVLRPATTHDLAKATLIALRSTKL